MRFAIALQALGALLAAAGLWMLFPWLGVFAAGVLILGAGLAAEAERRSDGTAESGSRRT